MNGQLDDPHLELRASKPRRVVACGGLVVIGAMFLWSGARDGELAGAARALMAGIGVLWLWGAFEMWRGTARSLRLTDAGLVDSSGTEVAALERIIAVERGMISMKPSHGMVLRLSAGAPARWVPGLWWRLGARVGIGGLTAKNDTRRFGDALELRVAAQRDGQTAKNMGGL